MIYNALENKNKYIKVIEALFIEKVYERKRSIANDDIIKTIEN